MAIEAEQSAASDQSGQDRQAKSPSVIGRVLAWMTAGYPDGIPPTDRFPVIAVLKRRLTDEEVLDICAQVTADGSPAKADGWIRQDEVKELIRRALLEEPSDADIRRVSSRLAAGGWPLAGSPHTDDSGAA